MRTERRTGRGDRNRIDAAPQSPNAICCSRGNRSWSTSTVPVRAPAGRSGIVT